MVPLDSWLANCFFAGNTEDFLELKIHKAYLWLKLDPVHWFIVYSTPKLRNRYINIQYYNIAYREIYRDKVLFDSNVLLLGALEPWIFMTFHSVGNVISPADELNHQPLTPGRARPKYLACPS